MKMLHTFRSENNNLSSYQEFRDNAISMDQFLFNSRTRCQYCDNFDVLKTYLNSLYLRLKISYCWMVKSRWLQSHYNISINSTRIAQQYLQVYTYAAQSWVFYFFNNNFIVGFQFKTTKHAFKERSTKFLILIPLRTI